MPILRNQPLDLRLLRCFQVLMDERSVSTAAARLHLSQPGMSRALGRLRLLFNDPLLLKGRHEMTPTNRAIELDPEVRALLASADQITRKPMAFDPASARTKFRIMTPGNVEYILAPPLIRRLHADAPGVNIEFLPPQSDQALLSTLQEGQIDLRLGWLPKPVQTLRSRLLFRDAIVCVARKEHPEFRGSITLEQYLQALHVRVDMQRPPFADRIVDQTALKLHRQLRIALKVQSMLTEFQVVANSDLIATVPKRLATQLAEKEPLQLFRLPFNIPDVRIAMYWHELAQHDAAHRWLRQLLTEVAKTL